MTNNGCALDVVVCSVLIKGLCKAGRMHDALRFPFKSGFESNVVTNNVLIDGWCIVKRLGDALRTYRHMRAHNLVPDVVTLTTLIRGVANEGRLQATGIVFFQMLKRALIPDVVT